MTANDLDFVCRCVALEGWHSETRQVFEGLLAYEPGGCFLAESDSERAGFCVAVSYRSSGFFGELIVRREMRGKGIGARLLGHSLKYLESRNVRSVYLDGVLRAVSLYERAGFRKICRSLRFDGVIEGRTAPPVRPMRKGDLGTVRALDRNAFGEDRGFFLDRIFALHPELCRVREADGRICGFIMARRTPGLIYAGPWVTGDRPDHAVLLETLALENPGTRLRFGVLENNNRAVEMIESLGFRPDPESPWRMVAGETGNLGLSEGSIALGSPAKG